MICKKYEAKYIEFCFVGVQYLHSLEQAHSTHCSVASNSNRSKNNTNGKNLKEKSQLFVFQFKITQKKKLHIIENVSNFFSTRSIKIVLLCFVNIY